MEQCEATVYLIKCADDYFRQNEEYHTNTVLLHYGRRQVHLKTFIKGVYVNIRNKWSVWPKYRHKYFFQYNYYYVLCVWWLVCLYVCKGVLTAQKEYFISLNRFFVICLEGHRTMVNFAQAPAVSTSCVTLGHALLTLWTSGPSSVLNTTASPSGVGTTSGSPTPKWTVRLVSWYKSS